MSGRLLFYLALAKVGRVLFVLTWPFRPFARGARLVHRSAVALLTLPIVVVDAHVTRINLMRVQTSVATTEANRNVALVAVTLIERGERDAGRELLGSVIRAMVPKPIPMPMPFPPVKAPRDLRTQGDA